MLTIILQQAAWVITTNLIARIPSVSSIGLATTSFPANRKRLSDHAMNIAYGRKVTGRLALQLSGGPEYSTFRVPIGTQSSKLGVNANANIIYGFENGSFSAGYVHGLAGGSGVLTGSTADQLNSAATRRLGRIWSGNFNFGYAHNRAVANSAQAGLPTYNSWFAGRRCQSANRQGFEFGHLLHGGHLWLQSVRMFRHDLQLKSNF